MTVSSTTNRVTYTASGSGTFAYTFKIFNKTDLVVYNQGVLQTVDVDYTVTGVGVSGGGNVVFTVAPTSGNTIIIYRELPLTQITDYQEGDPFPAETHESALDRLVMISQQFSEAIERFLKLPTTSTLSGIEIPIGANKGIRWNSAGDNFELFSVDPSSTSVITTKGDIILGNALGVPERKAVGATDQVPTVEGGTLVYKMPTVAVRKNTGGTDVGRRRRLNLIEGSNITLTIADDATGEEIDVTIASAVKKKIFLPASCFETRVAAGWAEFIQGQGTNIDWGEFDFDKDTDEKIISPVFRMTSWSGGNITVRLGWKANATTGDVMWVVSFLGRDTTTPEAWDAAPTDHAQAAVACAGTAEYLKESVFTITASELANNDAVIMKISRDADHASDTLAVDAKLLYVEIEFTE